MEIFSPTVALKCPKFAASSPKQWMRSKIPKTRLCFLFKEATGLHEPLVAQSERRNDPESFPASTSCLRNSA